MKTKLFLILWLAGSFQNPTYGVEENSNSIVQNEYVKVQTELSQSLGQARKALRDLGNDKKKAVLDSQNRAKVERQGIEALKKYDLLITIRYANDKGEYQPAQEVSQKDTENLNKLFDIYLHTTPLLSRTSVGNARKTIEWGIRRLEDLSKIHADPTESNNPDLEIIAQQTKDAEQRIKTVTELANRLGVRLNETVATGFETTTAPEVRRPASTAR